MSEHMLPEPDPEPLGASPLEVINNRPSEAEAAEMDRLMYSMRDAITFLINRNDGIRKTLRVFQETKVLPLLEKDQAGKTKNQGQVYLYSYGYFGSVHSPAEKIYNSEEYDSEYNGRRVAGIDLVTPVADADEGDAILSTVKYRIILDNQKQQTMKQLCYDEQRDTEVPCDVDEDTIAEIGLLLQSLRGDA